MKNKKNKKGDNKMFVVFKNNKPLLSSKVLKTARVFSSIENARNFVINLMGVSNSLTPSNFRFVRIVDAE